MSFYLTLSSADGSKEMFRNNHGGDYRVQLDHILDMRSQCWEVALMEMIYTGQAFPNIPTQDSVVTLKASDKPQFENDYIFTFDQTINMWISFTAERHNPTVPGGRERLKDVQIYLPQQHYSWTTFVETLKRLCTENFKMGHVQLTEQEFQFSEKNLRLDLLFNMKMSKIFTDAFGIDTSYKQIHDHSGRWVHFKHKVTKIPKPVPDSSLVFFSPYAVRSECCISVNGQVIFRLSNQYWTVNMFKRAINVLGAQNSSALAGMSIEDGPTTTECVLVLTAKTSTNVELQLSSDFQAVFQTTFSVYNFKENTLRIPLTITVAEDNKNLKWDNFESSARLQSNYYPTIGALIKDLNKVLSELIISIAMQRHSSTLSFTFFSLQDDVVTFTNKPAYTVVLSVNMLKLLHLPNLSKTVTGSEPVVMKEHKRSHFYIHLDCLDYHYINNNASDLLKVVPNTAAIDEKLQVTFTNPYYYNVARRNLSTINTYITDSYFDGILHFDRDVACTLHFRKCHSA